MTVNEMIRNAVTPFISICEPHSYDGSEPVYCVFNYTIIPWTFADGRPNSVNYVIQVHLYIPSSQDPVFIISSISLSLQRIGFSCPEIRDASDDISQHYVFEFSYVICESDVVLNEHDN